MWGRIYPHVLLLIFVKIFKASCMGTSSLTYVIDDTGSMQDDINQVKRSANKLMDIVFDEKASVIKNMVLVTVNDPDSQLRVVTEDRATFRNAFNSIYAHNIINYDCWEPSIQGILLAMENSLPGSYIYVFTDASAKDHHKKVLVKQMCQKKQSQIVFVLTGRCYHSGEESFRVYYDIADACSGLVFFVNSNGLNQVLDTIKETIKGNKTVIARKTIPANTLMDIPFTIDDQTDYAIVHVSGEYVYLSIKGPLAQYETLMWHDNGKVIKISNATPGQYVATVKGRSSTSILIVGRTDFHFTHGFSELVPKTMGDTTPQPIADTNVYLSVSITDPKHLVNIESAQILNDKEIAIGKPLDLKRISKDFYITSKPFVAPSHTFKISVQGTVIATGKSISRINKIPITPQVPVKKPNEMKPAVKIEEGRSIEVQYNSSVKLTCRVWGYPRPEITWFNNKRTTVKFSNSKFEEPYEYISYMDLPNALEDVKLFCHASNRNGKDSKTINVKVKDPLVVNAAPSGVTKVLYGSEGTITCDIKSPLPMKILWYYANENTGVQGQILSSDKYRISSDGTQLTITKMDMDLVGRYTCKASLIHSKDKNKTYNTIVEVDGLIRPQLTGPTLKKVIKGTSALLKCSVAKGFPVPKITWQFKEKTSTEYTHVPGSNVLHIKRVSNRDAGQYKCLAENIAGKDEHVVTLIIQERPQITSRPTSAYKGIEGDALLRIPCVTTGLPKPTITWKLNGHAISTNAKYSIEDAGLIINNPSVSDTNSYTCEAKNEVGVITATFKTHILQTPKVSGVPNMTVRIGSPVSIECTVVKGEPKPKIAWLFKDKSTSTFSPIAGLDNVLRISKVEKKDAGSYKCVAQNSVGGDAYTTALTVEFPPEISSNSSIYEGLEGDLALRIPCDVVGIPEPVVSWKLRGDVIKPNAKYAIEDGALVIKDPKKNDSKTFTCEATNALGSASAEFNASITEDDINFGKEDFIYLLRDETKKLNCETFSSKFHSIRWFINGVYNKTDESYELINATVDNDGNYTCRASDKHGYTYTHTYVVDVGHPPILYKSEELNAWRGVVKDIFSQCEAITKPEATIEWKFNDQVLSERDVREIGISYKWGHYSCNVSNVHGSVQRSFDVESTACLISRNLKDAQYMPLLLTDDHTWRHLETTKYFSVINPEDRVQLSCPNHKGASNVFQKFPNQTKLTAICNKEDTLIVDGNSYKVSDLQCSISFEPSIIRKKEKCLTEKSEFIRVGYSVSGFLETYEVCYDHATDMPLYTRVLMTKTDRTLNPTQNWYKYPGIGDSKVEKGFTCKDSLSSCCYSKSQLVNARDFSSDPEKYSTFIDPLNVVPVWRPCRNDRNTSWEVVEELVRTQLLIYSDFICWSGTHTLQEKDGQVIPRYLWKVLQFDEDEAIAIVYVNDRSPTEADIKCENICTKESVLPPKDKYTYCCSLKDFLMAFDLTSTDIGESLDNAIEKIEAA